MTLTPSQRDALNSEVLVALWPTLDVATAHLDNPIKRVGDALFELQFANNTDDYLAAIHRFTAACVEVVNRTSGSNRNVMATVLQTVKGVKQHITEGKPYG